MTKRSSNSSNSSSRSSSNYLQIYYHQIILCQSSILFNNINLLACCKRDSSGLDVNWKFVSDVKRTRKRRLFLFSFLSITLTALVKWLFQKESSRCLSVCFKYRKYKATNVKGRKQSVCLLNLLLALVRHHMKTIYGTLMLLLPAQHSRHSKVKRQQQKNDE